MHMLLVVSVMLAHALSKDMLPVVGVMLAHDTTKSECDDLSILLIGQRPERSQHFQAR